MINKDDLSESSHFYHYLRFFSQRNSAKIALRIEVRSAGFNLIARHKTTVQLTVHTYVTVMFSRYLTMQYGTVSTVQSVSHCRVDRIATAAL
jgi:hypothetical protein